MTIFENHERLALHEPLFSRAGDFLFLTIKQNDRIAIATTIERLIDALDAMEPDPDLEPYLAGTTGDDREGDDSLYGDCDRERDDCDDEPSLASPEISFSGVNYYYSERTLCVSVAPTRSQVSWAFGGYDDREYEDEREHDLDLTEGEEGWVDGSDGEPELGWPEQMHQEERLILKSGWLVEGGEPELGWTGHGTGCRDGEPTDDREGDDERAPNEDEGDYDGGEGDAPGFIWGGGDGTGGAPHAAVREALEHVRSVDTGPNIPLVVPSGLSLSERPW
jgi:hypothetical protein